ncbi:McrB family protein [Aliarcobacter butzleri]|uniref:McrB family protein n=1 Tax=Aliarcobacter butzleri TaxID=28197 RepID=UPI0021B1F8E1|nr:AAA family ATPase [Aliarcobacter butzleri]MCT7556452.1 AAA family ATPase [Aliarcobacter butzleri]
MTLTKEKLKSLYKNKYFNKQSKISERFSNLIELFDEIKDLEKEDLIKNIEPKPSENPFGPAKDSLTRDKAFDGVKAIADKFYEIDDVYHKIIISIGSILGGFDFKNHQMKDEYRIISNSSKSSDDFRASLTSQGQSRHPSSHFADNNYFFNIVEFVNHLDWSEAKMVLRYPNELLKVENDDEDFSMEYQKQKAILESRFPPKFLWMWANKSNVIYPISLMAFRNFLDTEFGKDIINELNKDYTPELITNMKFDEFKTIWTNISNKILVNLEIEKNHENLENLSKLISKICIEETDIKNISDLLTTGNKAVILWGPPGTGKTYESEQVVKELLEVKEGENFEEKYLFSKGYMNRNEKGYYEIVQFHPNYTYQDFIGGISPKLRGNNVSYELREGIFKKFCDTANKDENKNKKFIFIIDEINRAELSAVFGELLYALEYRGKSINLPHFKSPFTIPSNVYIIGTMNNVDKSLVTFDLALRRRFGFFKLMPKLEVIKDVLSEVIDEESLSKYYDKCEKLNKNIVIKLDLGENYQIGQAYFLKIRDFLEKNENEEIIENQNITSFELEKLWIYNLEPLLEEYLGMSIEDNEVMSKLKSLKEEFLKDN